MTHFQSYCFVAALIGIVAYFLNLRDAYKKYKMEEKNFVDHSSRPPPHHKGFEERYYKASQNLDDAIWPIPKLMRMIFK